MADFISKALYGIIIIRFIIIRVVTKSVHILFKEYILMTDSYFDVKIIIFRGGEMLFYCSLGLVKYC